MMKRRIPSISQDPVFLAIGDNGHIKQLTQQELQQILADPQNLNAYAYGRNNPLSYNDPTGQFPNLISAVKSAYNSIQNSVNNYIAKQNAVVSSPEYQAKSNEAMRNGMIYLGTTSTGRDISFDIMGSVAPGSKIANELKLGENLGKLGNVIGNSSGKIDSLSDHAVTRFFQRSDLTFENIANTVKNPTVTFQQPGDKVARLTKEAFVVIDQKINQVVTWYSKNEFKSDIKNILDRVDKK